MNGNANWKPPDRPIPGAYKRKEIIRPSFSLVAVILDFLSPPVLIVIGICYLSEKSIIPEIHTKTYMLCAFLAYVFFRLKQITLWLILIYQKYAPDYVRQACVFEPTCSEYMYRAICKYGLLAGGVRGIKRLFRCHDPNGGVDEP